MSDLSAFNNVVEFILGKPDREFDLPEPQPSWKRRIAKRHLTAGNGIVRVLAVIDVYDHEGTLKTRALTHMIRALGPYFHTLAQMDMHTGEFSVTDSKRTIGLMKLDKRSMQSRLSLFSQEIELQRNYVP